MTAVLIQRIIKYKTANTVKNVDAVWKIFYHSPSLDQITVTMNREKEQCMSE